MRSFPRLAFNIDIDYGLAEQEEIEKQNKNSGKTKDISKGGICLITNSPLKVGDILTLKFKLQNDESVINALGRVVWTQAFAIGQQRGYDNGIEFIKILKQDKDTIEKFVKKMFALE